MSEEALRDALVRAAEEYATTRAVLRREESELRTRLEKAEARARLEPDAVAELETMTILCEEWPRHAARILARARDALDTAAEALVEAS